MPHRAILGAGHQPRAVGREDRRIVQSTAVSAEHGDQFARPGVPEPERGIGGIGDEARAVGAEEDVVHPARMPAEHGDRLSRDAIPEPGGLIHRRRRDPPAVRAEDGVADASSCARPGFSASRPVAASHSRAVLSG